MESYQDKSSFFRVIPDDGIDSWVQDGAQTARDSKEIPWDEPTGPICRHSSSREKWVDTLGPWNRVRQCIKGHTQVLYKICGSQWLGWFQIMEQSHSTSRQNGGRHICFKEQPVNVSRIERQYMRTSKLLSFWRRVRRWVPVEYFLESDFSSDMTIKAFPARMALTGRGFNVVFSSGRSVVFGIKSQFSPLI